MATRTQTVHTITEPELAQWLDRSDAVAEAPSRATSLKATGIEPPFKPCPGCGGYVGPAEHEPAVWIDAAVREVRFQLCGCTLRITPGIEPGP